MTDTVDHELLSAAKILNGRYKASTGIGVRVERRWSGPVRVQGLCAWDQWTDVFEPVRHRAPWSRRWRMRQAPADAAEKMEWFFANRPDLPPAGGPGPAEPMSLRYDVVIDLTGWDNATRLAAVGSGLALIRDLVTDAETDIPWHLRESWPDDVVAAAHRLRERYVPQAKRSVDYMQTGVQSTTDPADRDAFATFAPFAYDSAFWSNGSTVASVNDEGTSFVLALTAEERQALSVILGAQRVVPLRDWRARHPSALRRLTRLVSRR